jgi:hypothetical protein
VLFTLIDPFWGQNGPFMKKTSRLASLRGEKIAEEKSLGLKVDFV